VEPSSRCDLHRDRPPDHPNDLDLGRARHINVGSTSTGTPRVGGFSTSTLAGSLCPSTSEATPSFESFHRRAYGFRTPGAMIALGMPALGGLCPDLPDVAQPHPPPPDRPTDTSEDPQRGGL
jgi:hypothetical protein